MAINVHNSKWLLLAIVSLTAVAGCCCQAVPLPGENQCPTDARRLYCACGEEAVRRCPCGPDSEFYGLKPTCWRTWPEGWHCNGFEGTPCCSGGSCGEAVAEAPDMTVPAEATVEAPMQMPAETLPEKPAIHKIDRTNPFRGNPGAADLPLPPKTTVIPAPQSKTEKPAPVQLLPPEPAPSTAPVLENTPSPTPTEPSPMPKQSATEQPNLKVASANVEEKPLTRLVLIPVPTDTSTTTTNSLTAAPQLNAPENAPAVNTEVTNSKFTKPVLPKATVQVIEPEAAKPAGEKPASGISAAANVQVSDPEVSNRVGEHLLRNVSL